MLGLFMALGAVLIFCGALNVLARLVFPLPSLTARRAGSAIPLSEDTGLGRLVAEGQAANPGKTGVLAIAEGRDALASRLELARRAEASIDAQYYIWSDDTAGRLMLKALHEAAQRGVRVRLLLDDDGTEELDNALSALNATDNFEVRQFNPSRVRSLKAAGYFIDFFRMNRRMHNKAFIVDGAAAIVGGRNIADEYFQLADEGFFIDLDVLAAGAVVPDTAAIFDAYWNSDSAYPLDLLADRADAGLPAWLTGDAAVGARDDAVPERRGTAADRFARGETALEWVDASVLADHPAKGLGKASGDQLMINRLRDAAGDVASGLDLVSAYFIPATRGIDYFAGLAGQGVRMRILTNGFRATDVKMVHAGYAKYRRKLLEAGIDLFELKPETGAGGGGKGSGSGSSGSSAGASLHAKTLALDGNRIFVGSFNFDPRSARLNCEMGFLIESPAMAKRMMDRFDTLATDTYAVRLEGGALNWTETGADGGETVHGTEPGTGPVDRLAVRIFGWLPIEWLL